MPEQFRVTFDQPPYHILVRSLVDSEAFVDDVKHVASMTDGQVGRVRDTLDRRSFTVLEDYLQAFEEAEIEQPRRTGGALHRLVRMTQQSGESDDLKHESTVTALRSSSGKISDDEAERFGAIFRRLCLEPVSLRHQAKAEHLAEATGCRVDALELVADMRPVFDDEPKQILGVLPKLTLRIAYDDGESRRLDLRLTPEQLESLDGQVHRAVKKQELMQKTIASSSWDKPKVNS